MKPLNQVTGGLSTFSYDRKGNRTSNYETFVYNDENQQVQYRYEPHSRGRKSDGVTYYRAFYHADRGGNVTFLINENNVAGATYRYDPFGRTIGSVATGLATANTYRFSSKEWCGTSALYYYSYRFYDPAVQRWLNRDPLANKAKSLFKLPALSV